jgi:uncharacterized protein (DUF4415 family)
MKKERTPISSRKGIKISQRTRELYERRDKSLDNDPERKMLPPEKWAHAMTREEFFRPIKKPISARIDADVLHWLKSSGEGYQTRLNSILRRAMELEQKQNA